MEDCNKHIRVKISTNKLNSSYGGLQQTYQRENINKQIKQFLWRSATNISEGKYLLLF
jgi:hypothetical protein